MMNSVPRVSLKRMRKAARAVYVAVPQEVAADLSEILTTAADEIEGLRELGTPDLSQRSFSTWEKAKRAEARLEIAQRLLGEAVTALLTDLLDDSEKEALATEINVQLERGFPLPDGWRPGCRTQISPAPHPPDSD